MLRFWSRRIFTHALDPTGGANGTPPESLAGFGGREIMERAREGKVTEGKRERRGEGRQKRGEGKGRVVEPPEIFFRHDAPAQQTYATDFCPRQLVRWKLV